MIYSLMNKIIIARDRPHSQLQSGHVWRQLDSRPLFEGYPHIVFDCKCQLCTRHELNTRHKNAQQFVAYLSREKSLKTDYELVLRCLTIPRGKSIKGHMGIRIRETCIYQKGQPIGIYMNRSVTDLTIKEVTRHMNHTLIQKTFNDCRRAYREKTRYEGRQAALMHFHDQPPQLFTETQFIGILAKRKSDPYWQNVARITNFTWSEDLQQKRHMFWFHNSLSHGHLMKRAKKFMDSLVWISDKSDPQFITSQEQQAFELSLKDGERAIYSSYKLVCWLKRVHSIEVKFGLFEWTVDSLSTMLLLDVRGMSYKQQPRFDWNQQVYQTRIKSYIHTTLQKKPKIPEEELDKQRIEKLSRTMAGHFYDIKQKLGFMNAKDDNSFEDLNDAAYSIIHPEQKLPLSQMLKSGVKIDALKPGYRAEPNYVRCKMSEILNKLTRPRPRTQAKARSSVMSRRQPQRLSLRGQLLKELQSTEDQSKSRCMYLQSSKATSIMTRTYMK